MAARAVSMDDLRLYIKKGRKKERERQREREREREKERWEEGEKERERERKKMRFTGRQSTHCNPKYRRWNRLPCHLAGSANADS